MAPRLALDHGGSRRAAPEPARSRRPTAARVGAAPLRRPVRPGPLRRTLRLANPARRLTAGFAALAALLAVLGGRLVQLQGVDGQQLAKRAQDQRLRTFDLPSLRGEITDRDGNVLAYSVEVRDIVADPTMVKDPARTAHALTGLLPMPEATLRAELSRTGTRNVLLARGLTPAEASRVKDAHLAGIFSQSDTRRLYPAHSVAANLVGFAGRDGTGLAGIEHEFNTQLAGRSGVVVAEGGRGGQLIPGTVHRQTESVPGSTVQLTIDEDMQFVTQTALAGAVQRSGAKGGQAVVLDRRTGEVLALAVVPTFDAQQAQDGDVTRSTPLGNPAVSDVFEPGSVNKMVTFAAALEAGLIGPSTVLEVPGSIKVADRIVHDAWSHGLVRYTATGVVAKSSNVGTLMVAQRLGPQTFDRYLRKFGLGSKTGIELPNESGGLLPSLDRWSGSTFGNLPIGQGLSMTILQMAGMYQAVANDGLRIQPRIVRAVVGPDGGRSEPVPPAEVQVISPQTAKTLRYMLEAVVQAKGGTAPSATIDSYLVAGKTGTAQQPDPGCGCYSKTNYWATFAGMAPADDPRLVVGVMIDSPRAGLHGGAIAAPTFRQIMAYGLKQRAIPPTGAPVPSFTLSG